MTKKYTVLISPPNNWWYAWGVFDTPEQAREGMREKVSEDLSGKGMKCEEIEEYLELFAVGEDMINLHDTEYGVSPWYHAKFEEG
jgi:hypothetical protein